MLLKQKIPTRTADRMGRVPRSGAIRTLPGGKSTTLQACADASPHVSSLRVLQHMASGAPAQRVGDGIYGSEQLRQAALQGGDAKTNAVAAITSYFDDAKLRISKVHSVYASRYDKKTGEVGAEFHLSSSDKDVSEIASNWVFHTHAVAETRDNFYFKRDFGANHIKPAAEPFGRISLSFHSDTAFQSAESKPDIQRSFSGALRRALQNAESDPYAARKDKRR